MQFGSVRFCDDLVWFDDLIYGLVWLGLVPVHSKPNQTEPNRVEHYAEQYGDFTIVDGTFNICAYDLKMLVFTNVILPKLSKITYSNLSINMPTDLLLKKRSRKSRRIKSNCVELSAANISLQDIPRLNEANPITRG